MLFCLRRVVIVMFFSSWWVTAYVQLMQAYICILGPSISHVLSYHCMSYPRTSTLIAFVHCNYVIFMRMLGLFIVSPWGWLTIPASFRLEGV